MRGVGVLSDSNQPARDQGVGVYMDGVYLGRPQALGAALFEISNVEVLKGPQGTLFGRNTEGGAVSITTVRPRGEFRLDATAGMGNYGAYNGVIHLDLPSYHDVSLKFDGILTRRGGFVLNPLAGASNFNGYDRRGLDVRDRAEERVPGSPLRLNLAGYTGTYKSIQLDFSGQYQDFVNGVRVVTTRTTTDTVNAPGTGRLRGAEAELEIAPVDGLQLSGSFAYNHVRIPDTVNSFKQTINGVAVNIGASQHIYQVYTPEYAASGALDYHYPLEGATLAVHVEGNSDSGFYVNYTDALIDSQTRAVRVAQPKGDPGFVVNGRIALTDIAVGSGNARLGLALWSRNLFNEQHLFYRATSPTGGTVGFFNDPRTAGLELNLHM